MICERCIADVLWLVEKTLRDATGAGQEARAIEWTITDDQDEGVDGLFAQLHTLHLRVHQHGETGLRSYMRKETAESITPIGSPAHAWLEQWDYSREDGGLGVVLD